jgi:hypothetical protein
MYNIIARKQMPNQKSFKIRQIRPQRGWMNSETYNCYPIVSANSFGYGIYHDEDISFSWSGKIHEPAKEITETGMVWEGRGEGTVSFNTNLIFETDIDVSLLTMEVPNNLSDKRKDYDVVTTLLTSSFFRAPFPIVLKLYDTNVYTITAGTDIACILPINVSDINNSVINIKDKSLVGDDYHAKPDYVNEIKKLNSEGIRPKFYKAGTDAFGNKIGQHQVDKFNLYVRGQDGIE